MRLKVLVKSYKVIQACSQIWVNFIEKKKKLFYSMLSLSCLTVDVGQKLRDRWLWVSMALWGLIIVAVSRGHGCRICQKVEHKTMVKNKLETGKTKQTNSPVPTGVGWEAGSTPGEVTSLSRGWHTETDKHLHLWVSSVKNLETIQAGA